MNKVILVGNLTADPEIKKMQDGTARCSFRIAVQRNFKNAQGNRDADFISITVWRQLAELCGKYLQKGRKVCVVGRLSTRKYNDENGETRYVTDVVADEVEFLTAKKDEGGASAQHADPGQKGLQDYYPGDYPVLDDDDENMPF